jgi:tetratricopeptide (TPR) repeat protein
MYDIWARFILNYPLKQLVKARFLLLFALLLVSPVVSAQTPAPIRGEKIKPQATTITPKQEASSQVGKLATDLEQLDKSFTIIIFFIAKVLAGLLSVLVIYRIILLILNRPSQLVIDNFTNASGETNMDGVLSGLSQLGRQRLIQEMNNVHQRVKQHSSRVGLEAVRPEDKLPLPKTTPDQRLTDLVASLQQFTPDQIDPAVQLLNVMFPPHGTKVSSILQSQGDEHHKLGITFEISDLQGNAASKLYTVWESAGNSPSVTALKDRYRELLKPATRWLAIELCRREMIVGASQFSSGKERQAYEAKVHNFFGVFNQTSGQTHGKFFYRLAIADLQAAIAIDPDWHQPYENLAETYTLIARQETKEQSLHLYNQAIANYNKAIGRVTDNNIKHHIQIAKAIAQLLTGEENLIQDSKQEISSLESTLDFTQQHHYRLLYYLACWYAIAHGMGVVEQAQQQARRYLTYSLARETNPDFWQWTSKDPDLASIRDGLAELQNNLSAKLHKHPEISTLTGKEFIQPITEVMQQVDWSLPSRS